MGTAKTASNAAPAIKSCARRCHGDAARLLLFLAVVLVAGLAGIHQLLELRSVTLRVTRGHGLGKGVGLGLCILGTLLEVGALGPYAIERIGIAEVRTLGKQRGDVAVDRLQSLGVIREVFL